MPNIYGKHAYIYKFIIKNKYVYILNMHLHKN